MDAVGGGGGPPVDVFLSPALLRLSSRSVPFAPTLVLRSLGMPPANSPPSCCGGSPAAAGAVSLLRLSALTLLRLTAPSMTGADLSIVCVFRSPPLPNDEMSPNNAPRPPSPPEATGIVAEAENRAAGLLLHEKPAPDGAAGAAGAVGAAGGGGGGGVAEDNMEGAGGGVGGGEDETGGGVDEAPGSGDDGGVGLNIPAVRVTGGGNGLD